VHGSAAIARRTSYSSSGRDAGGGPRGSPPGPFTNVSQDTDGRWFTPGRLRSGTYV
jgi:hypothetical protein